MTAYSRGYYFDALPEQRARIRHLIFEKGAGICGICGEYVDFETMHLDHIIPLSRGGEDAEYNLQATPPFCNQSKNAKGDLPVLNPPSQTAMKGYMTSKEAAIRLGITPSGVVMQIHRGALAAEKIGRDWVISEDEARRYLRENAGKRGTSSPRHRGTGGRPPKDRGEVS